MGTHTPFHLEHPRYDTIAGICTRPRTKRVFLHRPGDFCIVEARPDFTFLLKDAISPQGAHPLAGFGFLFGAGKQIVDIESVAKSFEGGSVPILSQSVLRDGVAYRLVSFCMDHALRLRLTAVNRHPASPRNCLLYFSAIQSSMCELYEHGNEDYVPYQADNRPWLSPLDGRLAGGRIMLGEAVKATLAAAEGFTVQEEPSGRSRLIAIEAVLQPGGQAAVEWMIPYGPQECRSGAARSWDEAYRSTVAFYKGQLKRGTRLCTPDPVVNRAFDTLRLSSLQMMGAKPGSDVLYPGQGGMNPFGTVYGMETSCWVPMLDRLGYHDEAGRVMAYLLTTQENSPGPEGDISDPAGSFRPHIHWMCETGAVLTMLCSHCLYVRDEEWFMGIAGQLMAACRFIIRERARTKEMLKPGEPGYGLLPAGRPHDWPDYGQFLFSDAYTWKGLNLAAKAFTVFGHPDAPMLAGEAADYRQCILDSFRKSVHPHPEEAGRLWFSSEVHTPAGKEVGSYSGDGPICLLSAGLLSADDPIVAQIEYDAVRRGIMTPLFAGIMKQMEDETLAAIQRRCAGGSYDLIYVTFSEVIWHRAFMQSGQREKALAYFYSTLAFATSYDLGITHERFSPQLPWLLPWQPNASANGRILEMIASAICHEDQDRLYLFAGVPEDWLDEGVSLEDYAILCGMVSVTARRDHNRLIVKTTITDPLEEILPSDMIYCLPERWIPEQPARPVNGKKGWWQVPLALNCEMVFRSDCR